MSHARSSDPDVFARYIKNYGPEANLFVDRSQVVQPDANWTLRSRIQQLQAL